MTALQAPLSQDELEALDLFLRSNESPADTLAADQLHGFLTALVCLREETLPSVWMPVVWGGGEEPGFQDLDRLEEMLRLMMRMHNSIAAQLEEATFRPLLSRAVNQEGVAFTTPQGWCDGFVRGIGLNAEHWSGALGALSEQTSALAVLAGIGERSPEVEQALQDPETFKTLSDSIPERVQKIYRYFREPHPIAAPKFS